ncbi:hypothetical protein F3Y22_tig00000340pilonHSYRG00145 [Hibiscus syriacus]|uniref:Uncharacterized protein n=1 Tax=Hibiscus syriacus TaxID=106335 RepID=A0A6A3D112_HIBSY|nr:hypothetical protein F3Y22_tig00000340pilonHSYRG00145 [Hibiscus syriacus]
MEQQRNAKMVQQQQEESEEIHHGLFPVEQLQASGIAALGVNKLKDGAFSRLNLLLIPQERYSSDQRNQ